MSIRNTKRAIVTGGAGFIGSHLVDYLVADGWHVIAIDNLVSGKANHLAQHERESRFELIEADINDLSKSARAYHGVDWVFHLASLADIVPSMERPLEYHQANVMGTFNVLECARGAHVKRFIYSASSSCYGIPDIYPTPEDAPLRPQYPYALTKALGEQYVLGWSKFYRFPALSLRFFNVFGPRARAGGTYGAVFKVFLAQKLKGLPFTVVGDGTQVRDFTYVTDIAEALILAARSKLAGEAMNVGTGTPRSVNDLVGLLGGKIVYIPKRPGEPDSTHADIRKISRLLGWSPKVSFERGVQLMLDNIEYWADAPAWTPESIEQATSTWFKYLQ